MSCVRVLLCSLFLVFAGTLLAGEVDMCNCECGLSCGPMRITICPEGDLEPIRNGCGGSSDCIWVVARDADGNGISNIPWCDYWLNACDPAQELCLCEEPITADALTDEDGFTTISGSIRGWGCILSGGVYLTIQGKVIYEYPSCINPNCLEIYIVSPDINSDCIVDLSDFGAFGQSYNRSEGDPYYNPCCDYNDDGRCNLSDFSYFGMHYQHECPH